MIEIKDFLKKYSNISNQFIDDFFSINNYNYFENNFVIDLDIVVKWLDTYKRNLKLTLITSYLKNVDYTIEKIKKEKGSGSGASLKEKILLTPTCFKKLCQLTKSKKGDEIREYFIKVEETLFRYKDYIINGLQNKIKKLEHNQKPKIYPTCGVIYVFETPNTSGNSLYKIGKTKDLKQRLKSHQSPLSNDINILYYFETDDINRIEKCLKTFIKPYQYRKYKEVYQVNIDIIKDVISSCANISENIKLREDADKKYFIHISNK